MALRMAARTLARSSDVDIESRRPVWAALSELFLDTNLDSADLNRIAKTLAISRYSLGELDQILLWEVFPRAAAICCRSPESGQVSIQSGSSHEYSEDHRHWRELGQERSVVSECSRLFLGEQSSGA
jgi:hypothetical protein